MIDRSIDFCTVRFEFGTYTTVQVKVFFDKNLNNDSTSHDIYAHFICIFS